MRSGVRGFVVGSFALIVLYVALQPNSPKVAAAGGNVIVAGMRRLLSPDVAGIPQRKSGALVNAGTGLGEAAGAGAAAGAGHVGGGS